MGWVKKLLGKQESHEEWLEKHHGKESKSSPPPMVTEAEADATRTRMEEEMSRQRANRG